MDAVGSLSEIVGKETFRTYLPQMMRQAFEGLEMGSIRLSECVFLFFGAMARVFGEEFALGGKGGLRVRSLRTSRVSGRRRRTMAG